MSQGHADVIFLMLPSSSTGEILQLQARDDPQGSAAGADRRSGTQGNKNFLFNSFHVPHPGDLLHVSKCQVGLDGGATGRDFFS